jgi:hypothetical protein
MKVFLSQVEDSVRYALSDRKGMFTICSLMAITSFINKNGSLTPIMKLVTVTLLIVMGYGSFVSWHTLKGSDDHPKLENNLRRITLEGFKKTLITVIYSGFLVIFIYHAKLCHEDGNIIFAAGWIALFVSVYLCLIGGLLNRYLHRGKFKEAFNLVEIIKLLSMFDIESFIRVMTAVVISQTFAITVVIPFADGFSQTELLFSIASFFLAPFLYIANKRLVGLNIRRLLQKQNIKRHDKE